MEEESSMEQSYKKIPTAWKKATTGWHFWVVEQRNSALCIIRDRTRTTFKLAEAAGMRYNAAGTRRWGLGYQIPEPPDAPLYVLAEISDCRNPTTGEIEGWVQALLEGPFKDAYAEVDPQDGTGVQFIFQSSKDMEYGRQAAVERKALRPAFKGMLSPRLTISPANGVPVALSGLPLTSGQAGDCTTPGLKTLVQQYLQVTPAEEPQTSREFVRIYGRISLPAQPALPPDKLQGLIARRPAAYPLWELRPDMIVSPLDYSLLLAAECLRDYWDSGQDVADLIAAHRRKHSANPLSRYELETLMMQAWNMVEAGVPDAMGREAPVVAGGA
jgi:hypothetical protein